MAPSRSVVLFGLVAQAAVATAPTAFMIDQGGNNGAGFPFSDLVGWGVKQVTGGSIDCTALLNSIPGGPWYNAAGLAYVAQQVTESQAQLAAAHAAGLKIYFTSDIFQVPTLLFNRYAQNLTWPNSTCFGYTRGPTCIDIRSNFTQEVMRALFTELLETFPTVDGLVLRYGENSPCNYHEGNAPYDTSDAVPSLQLLLNFLREELCVKRGLDVIFRTWDTSTQLFHANPAFYLNVTNAVEPHPRLVFSIKHTALDFWRRVALNPTLGIGQHRQVVEAEINGMYAGCGSWPLYIGDPLINGYTENSPPTGLAALFASRPEILGGVLTNHQCGTPATFAPFLWGRMEEAVIARWTLNLSQSEEALWDEYARVDLGVTDDSARAALRDIAVSGMAANLAIQTCAAFDPVVDPAQMDRPTANWMLWNAWGGLYQLDPTPHPAVCHA